MTKISLHFRYWAIAVLLLALYVSGLIDCHLSVKRVEISPGSAAVLVTAASIFFLSGLCYLNKKMNPFLTTWHNKIFGTGAAIILIATLTLCILFGSEEKRQGASALIDSGVDSKIMLLLIAGILVSFVGKLLLVVNIIISLFFSRHYSPDS